MPSEYKGDEVKEKCSILIKASELLDIPLIATEQYPKGLGKTVMDIPVEPIEKMEFSCFGNSDFSNKVSEYDSLVLFGIEAHVCIMQTALDAVSKGKRVYVAKDAVTSRNKTDKKVAIQRMRKKGVEIVTTEMILFEIMKTAEHPKFREVQALIK